MTAIALEQQRRDRTTGIITTVIFHVLLLILFLFIGLKQFDPPLQETMIPVEMLESAGGLDGGMNDPNSGGGQPATAPESEQPEEVATEEESEVEISKPVKPTKPRQETPKPAKPDPNALFNPSDNPGPDTEGPPGGGPNDTNKPGGGGTGKFHGEGFEGKLDGRGLATVPGFRNDNTDAGIVAVDIKVDATGKVIYAKGKLDRPTTTTSHQLHQLAEGYAKQFKFSARQGSGLDQVGYIVFVFKVK